MSSDSVAVALGGESVVSNAVRAKVAAGVDPEGPTVTNPEEPSVVVPTGPATVSAVNVAGASSVAINQALVEVASITVSAGSQPASVTGIKLTRSGLSPDTAISGITVWNGTQRLNVSNILAYGVADINFSSAVVIPANTSITLSVKVNVAEDDDSAPPGSQFAITVNELKGASTSTLIPATSGVQTVSNVKLGTLTVDVSGDAPTSNLDVGTENTPLAKFNFETTREDQLLKQVSFSQNSSAADTDFTNLKLFNNAGVQVGSEAIRNGRNVAFTFGDGLAIANGETLRLELRGDVIGGSGREVQFGIDDDTDVQSVGRTYGTTIVSTWSKNSSYTRDGVKLAINPGSFIVSRAETSPVAGDVGLTFKENVFTILRVEAIGEPIQVRSIVIDAATGTLPVEKLANLKLIYNGNTIAQVVDPFTTALPTKKVVLTAPITLSPGTPAYISITADTTSPLANSDKTKTIILGLAASSEAINGLGTVSAKTILYPSNSTVLGSVATVGDVQVTATAVPRGGTSIFQGQVGAELASFNLEHNLGETVSVTKLNVKLNESGSGTFTNLALYDAEGNVISDRITSAGTALPFTLKTPLKIEPDAVVKVTLKADVTSNAEAFVGISDPTVADGGVFQFTLDGSNSYALTTALGTTIDVKNAVAATLYTVRDGADAAVVVTESKAVSLDADINASQGATNVAVAAYQLENTGSEPVLVKKLYLESAFASVGGSISNVGVVTGFGATGNLGTSHIKNITIINNYDKSVLGKAEYLESGAAVTLTTPLYLGNSTSTKYADIVIQVDVISTAKRGGTYQITLGSGSNGDIEFQTQSTGKTISTGAPSQIGALPGSTLIVTPSTVSVTANSVSSITNSTGLPVAGNTIGSFTFTNHGSVAVVVDQVDLSDVLKAVDAVPEELWNKYVTVQLVKGTTVLNGSHVVDNTATTALDAPILLNSPFAGSSSTGEQLRLEAGASATVTVRVLAVDDAFKIGGGTYAETSVALQVLRSDYGVAPASAGTTFVVPNDAPTHYLVEDDAASAVVYYIKN
jgi:hypothetical protein